MKERRILMNKTENIVCNSTNSALVKEVERFINNKWDEGWDLRVIQDSVIRGLQNVIHDNNSDR